MNEPLNWILAGWAGVVLGTIFFGGLWWTVRKGVSSANPAAWFLGSMLLRMSIALVGFYFVAGDQWKRLVACLLGFLIARLGVLWFTRSAKQLRPISEVKHAS